MKNNLSDNQRRTICRVLFLLVCALPTFVTVYFASHQRSSQDWAQLLHAKLGVDTSIGAVETPRPGEMVFHDVKLRDNDGKVIFESLKAKVVLGNIIKIDFRDPIRVNREGLSHFLDEASERIVKTEADSKPWEVNFENFEIVKGADPNFENQPLRLQSVVVAIGNGHQGRQVTVSAAALGDVTLIRDSNSGHLSVEVNTKEHELPCWLATHWYPDIELLGSKAQFKGVAVVSSSGNSSTSALSGKFDRISLKPIPEFNPHVVDSAQSIFAYDLVLRDDVLLDGDAVLEMDDYQQISLNPYFLRPATLDDAPLNRVLQRAIREVPGSTALR